MSALLCSLSKTGTTSAVLLIVLQAINEYLSLATVHTYLVVYVNTRVSCQVFVSCVYVGPRSAGMGVEMDKCGLQLQFYCF